MDSIICVVLGAVAGGFAVYKTRRRIESTIVNVKGWLAQEKRRW